MAKTTASTIKRHLVVDEIVEFPCPAQKDVTRDYRMRIWRARGMRSVILLSQIEGGFHTDFVSARAANYANRVHLCHSAEGFTHWEANIQPVSKIPSVVVVFFDVYGSPLRLGYHKPIHTQKPMSMLEEIVGESISL